MGKKYVVDAKRKKTVSPECRGSYVNILEARPLPNSEELAWGMQCMFPKNDVVTAWVEELKQIYAQVLIDKFGDKKAREMAKVISAKNSFPVRDGDNPEDAGSLANADQLKGHYFINTNNRFRQPYIIGPMGKAVDPDTLGVDDIYSGAWYRVMLEFWYYDKAGNKGISTSIAGLMKTRDDDNLGAGTSKGEAEEGFGGFADEAASMFEEEQRQEAADVEAEMPDSDATDDFDFL